MFFFPIAHIVGIHASPEKSTLDHSKQNFRTLNFNVRILKHIADLITKHKKITYQGSKRVTSEYELF